MFHKKLALSAFLLAAIPTSSVQANYNDLSSAVFLFNSFAQGANHSLQALAIAKSLTPEDLEKALHGLNNAAWDLVVPVLVAYHIGSKYNRGTCVQKGATSLASGLSAGLLAHILGALPKEIINKLLDQAFNLRKKVESSVSA